MIFRHYFTFLIAVGWGWNSQNDMTDGLSLFNLGGLGTTCVES